MKEIEFEMVTTRGGDKGDTSMYSEERVVKSSPIFDLVGDLDELNSFLGIIRASLKKRKDPLFFNPLSKIRDVQKELMNISSLVVTNPRSDLYKKLKKIEDGDIENLEKLERKMLKKVTIKQEFIIPGDEGKESAKVDYARALTRRCERKIVSLIREIRIDLINSQKYLNRLSDFLFIFARYLEQN